MWSGIFATNILEISRNQLGHSKESNNFHVVFRGAVIPTRSSALWEDRRSACTSDIFTHIQTLQSNSAEHLQLQRNCVGSSLFHSAKFNISGLAASNWTYHGPCHDSMTRRRCSEEEREAIPLSEIIKVAAKAADSKKRVAQDLRLTSL